MDGSIPFPIFLGAAVVDSINPCAFGVLIFLLSYLTENNFGKKKMLVNGMSYIFAVFITYFLAGLILLPLLGSLGQFSVIAYVLLGIMVIIFGLLEIKDYFWYGKGPSLQLLPGSSDRIKTYVKNISDSAWSAFSLGIFVAIVELPCTGAVYLAILSRMAISGLTAFNIFLLVLYNIIFVAPLVAILTMFISGVKSERIETWRQAHKKVMRLLIGLVLIGLGMWMIHYALF